MSLLCSIQHYLNSPISVLDTEYVPGRREVAGHFKGKTMIPAFMNYVFRFKTEEGAGNYPPSEKKICKKSVMEKGFRLREIFFIYYFLSVAG